MLTILTRLGFLLITFLLNIKLFTVSVYFFMLSFLFLTAGISSIEVSLISVSDDLSTQRIEVNCSTFRVKPYEITWKINSESISVNDSTYLKENGSMLLSSANQTYIHYLILNGSFSSGKKISCTTTVNGEMDDEEYILQGISNTWKDIIVAH